METNSIIIEANQLTSQRLIQQYLPTVDGNNVWTDGDACISARPIPNRYGVPPDARSWRYLIQHPEQGWSYAVRAVWRNDSLMRPLAVHVVIENYFVDDETVLADEDAASLAANEWLCSLCL